MAVDGGGALLMICVVQRVSLWRGLRVLRDGEWDSLLLPVGRICFRGLNELRSKQSIHLGRSFHRHRTGNCQHNNSTFGGDC
jgi:hypothetical protein